MKRSSGHLSVFVGASILALMSLGLLGAVYSIYTEETAEKEKQQDSSSITEENNPFEQLKKEKNFVTAPVTESEGGAGRLETETGIPTGKYSNPPTTVNSFGGTDTATDSPINNYGSSVENNRLTQESFSRNNPDYSRPSSSNNFNTTSDNSLVDPLENDDFLNVPNESSSEEVETPSLSESLPSQ